MPRRPRSRAGPSSRPIVMTFAGLVWAIALLGGVAGGPVLLAVILTPVVVVGVVSAGRGAGRDEPVAVASSGRRRGPAVAARPRPGARRWAGLLLGSVPLVALGGAAAMLSGTAAGLASAAWSRRDGSGRPTLSSLVAVAAPAVAGGSLVLAARQGTQPVVVLVLAALMFDGANAVMGTGRTGGVVGALAGAGTIALLAVVVDALLDPPFTGSNPWFFCGLVAVLAPLGAAICGQLVPGRAPAVRRLDSLVLAAPAWCIAFAARLHH